MESQSDHRLEEGQEDVTKSSSDEETEGFNDDLGTGRSYECVFCKRGFTTAQALGGHMNIHRKERGAKARPTSAPTSVESKPADASDLVRTYRSLQSYTGGPHFAIAPEVEGNYRTYVPAPTWVIAPANSDHEEFCSRNYPLRRHPSLFATDDHDDDGQNWRSGSGLSLGIGPSAQGSDDDEHLGHDHQRKAMDGVHGGCSSEGDRLDLELRLGHDP